MQLDADTANDMLEVIAARLTGGYVDVFESETRLVRCHFAADPFQPPEEGRLTANPFPPGQAEVDGTPQSFVACRADGTPVLAGSAGYKDDEPKPEMTFKTRRIVQGADVPIEEFVFSLALRTGQAIDNNQQGPGNA